MLDRKTCQTVCKIKGFSVNLIASESVNFQSMRDLVLNRYLEETIAVEQNKFIREKKIGRFCNS